MGVDSNSKSDSSEFDKKVSEVKDLMKGLSVQKMEKILFESIRVCREDSSVL